MPWTLLPKLSWSLLYDRINQGLDYFYFINDQPLDELNRKGYYRNTIQYHEPYRITELISRLAERLGKPGLSRAALHRAESPHGMQNQKNMFSIRAVPAVSNYSLKYLCINSNNKLCFKGLEI